MGQTVEQAGQRAGRSLDDVRTRGAAFGAAMGTAIGSSLQLLGEFGRAAAEEQAIFARLQQAVENTGVSYLDYSDAINRAISRGQDLAFSDDQIADALGRMTTTTGDAQAALDNIGLAMDLARARGIDLSTAADLIGKAYTGNFATLSRFGIQLDANATSAEALAAIQQKTAGQAEAYGNTQAATIDRWQNKLDNATESLGAHAGQISTVVALLPGLTAGWSIASGAAGGLTGALAGEAGATGALGALGVSVGTLGVAAAAAAPAIAILAYTLYTAKDNMNQVTQETDAATEALHSGRLEMDDYARSVYGLVSQGLFNVEYTDQITQGAQAQTRTLESVFGELTALRGEYQAAFVDAAKYLEIDFTNPAADDIQSLIELILYYYRLQQESTQQQLELNRAVGLSQIQTPHGATVADASWKERNLDIGREVLAEGSVRDLNTMNAYAEQAGAYESSMYAAIKTTNAWSAAQAEADQQLRESLGGFYEMATGVTTAGSALSAFKATQDGLLESQQVYSQQQGEYQGQMSALEAGYTILQERQAEGIPLTKEEQDLLDNYPELYGRLQGGAEDAAVQQALLAAQYAENVQKGDELNRTLEGNTNATGDLVSIIEDLILSLDGVPPEVRTRIELERAQEALDQVLALQYALNAAAHTYVATFVLEQIGGNAPTGPQYLHGGVVGYANGGVIARMAEAGPELLHYRDGGMGLALTDGLYNVPRGTYVDTAPVTKGKLGGMGGPTIQINGPITVIANDPRQFSESLYEQAMSGVR